MSDKNKLTDKQLRVLIDEYSQSQTLTEYRPSDIANALTELRDRNRELEERLHERDLAVAALSQERDEAYDRGVREGMVLVRQQADAWLDGRERTMALSCYTAALEAYEKEVRYDED